MKKVIKFAKLVLSVTAIYHLVNTVIGLLTKSQKNKAYYDEDLLFGIHPEFVLPLIKKPDNKIPTPFKSFIKSFKTWLKS